MDWLAIVIFALIGGVIGAILTKLISPTKTIGTLRIDMSDSDGPYLFLELDKGVGDISREQYVQLKINTESYISRK